VTVHGFVPYQHVPRKLAVVDGRPPRLTVTLFGFFQATGPQPVTGQCQDASKNRDPPICNMITADDRATMLGSSRCPSIPPGLGPAPLLSARALAAPSLALTTVHGFGQASFQEGREAMELEPSACGPRAADRDDSRGKCSLQFLGVPVLPGTDHRGPRKKNRTKYFEVPVCQAATAATAEVIGAVTEKRSGTPKDQIPTPPYPWPDRATWVTMRGRTMPVFTGGAAPAMDPGPLMAQAMNPGTLSGRAGPGPSPVAPPTVLPKWRGTTKGAQGSTPAPTMAQSSAPAAEMEQRSSARARSSSVKRVAVNPLPPPDDPPAMEDGAEAYSVPLPADSLQAENSRLQEEIKELKTAMSQMMHPKS